jgi:GntR family transcriptional regulator/MocR family aminotransferase
MYQRIPPLNLDRQSGTPVYLQIASQLTQQILAGRLMPGQRLPGARAWAVQLRVHRKTLQNALDELAAQGWLTIAQRSGARVAAEIPKVKVKTPLQTPSSFPAQANFSIALSIVPLPPADFQHSGKLLLTEGLPDLRLAPIARVMRELRSIEKRGNLKRYFQYGTPQGIPYLREMFCDSLRESRNLRVPPAQLMITRGTQMGIFLAAGVLIKPGDRVVVGDPNYVTANRTFEQAGARLVRIPVDEQGLDIDRLEQTCKKTKVRMVYIIPHHHYPTTVTLSLERRIRLLNLAAKHKFVILEDDYDYDFHYSSGPIAPLASLDGYGNVIYLGTLTKTLMPALRIGFMAGPAHFIAEACLLRRLIDFQGDSILEAAIAELFRQGAISSFIKKAVRIYHQRRDSFCERLEAALGPHVAFKKPDGGLNVWVNFRQADLAKASKLAAEKGVLFSDGAIYNTPRSRNNTRLGFSALDDGEQLQAIAILKDCIQRSVR